MHNDTLKVTARLEDRMRGRLILGIILVILGVGGLLDIAGTWDFSGFLGTWWPAILILVGVLQVTRGHWFGPGILIAIGLFFLARNLGYFEREWSRFLWPVLVIVIGAALIFGALRGRRPRQSTSRGSFDRLTMFGGIDERVTGTFRGGSVLAFFGGAEIDLREADLSKQPVLDVVAAFGGITVIVPEGTHVRMEGTPIFGGMENKVASQDGGAHLTVKGVALFGGVEVTDRVD